MCSTSDFQSDGTAQRAVATVIVIVLIMSNAIISGRRMNISVAIVIITSTRLEIVVVVAVDFVIHGNSGCRR